MRCPVCQKLYAVDTANIKSLCPQFQCMACRSHFCFDFPPLEPSSIPTRRILVQGESTHDLELKTCPKCGTLNPATCDHCQSCQAAFEFGEFQGQNLNHKIEEPKPVSLDQFWMRIFSDYEDPELHEDFLKVCQKENQLEFAFKKYNDLKLAQGEDSRCQEMIDRIDALRFKPFHVQPLTNKVSRDIREGGAVWTQAISWLKEHWRQVLFWTPASLSVILVILGLSNMAFRNMVGIGIAISILSYGVLVHFLNFKPNDLKSSDQARK